MLKDVPNGAVIVDVAVDQGGCIETTHPTTHSDPTYYVEGVLHYCVGKHAGCSAADFDVRIDQCHAALCTQISCIRVFWKRLAAIPAEKKV